MGVLNPEGESGRGGEWEENLLDSPSPHLPLSHSFFAVTMSVESETPTHTSPRWQPLEAIERRILGVLVEKAKTTPENYPLSVNALKSGANTYNRRTPRPSA